MLHGKFIFIANSVPVIIILVMALLLCFASRFKGKSSHMALLVLGITLTDFIYEMCHLLNWGTAALIFTPFAYSTSLTLMPFMLILAYRTFNRHYTFKYIRLLHFIPAIGFAAFAAIYIFALQHNEEGVIEKSFIHNTPLTKINILILLAQLVIYTFIIFRYLNKTKKYILQNLSSAELAEAVWTPRFITLIDILIITAILNTLFNPLSGLRLFYLISVIAMGYLLYCELSISFASKKEQIPPLLPQEDEIEQTLSESDRQSADSAVNQEDKIEQMQQYAKSIEEYLQGSEAYINPNLSLKDVAKATGISAKNLSRSINVVLGKTFFDLINGYRIEKSKELLLAKKELGLTLETISEKCGFNSRFTLNSAFKKATGLTTTQWVKEYKNL